MAVHLLLLLDLLRLRHRQRGWGCQGKTARRQVRRGLLTPYLALLVGDALGLFLRRFLLGL